MTVNELIKILQTDYSKYLDDEVEVTHKFFGDREVVDHIEIKETIDKSSGKIKITNCVLICAK